MRIIKIMSQSSLNRNTFYNISAGLSTMLISIVLPPYLSRVLSEEELSVWILGVQIASFFTFLNLGLQIVVTTEISKLVDKLDLNVRNSVVSTAFFFVLFLSAIFWLLLVFATRDTNWIAPTLNSKAADDFSSVIRWIGASFVLWLPTSIILAAFAGQQRYGLFALAMLVSRFIILVSVLVTATVTKDIVLMAEFWFLATLFSCILIMFQWYNKVPEASISFNVFDKQVLSELLFSGSTITFWNLVVLLSTGVQTTLVGYYAISDVPVFSVALAISTAIVGVAGAVTSTLIPHVAKCAHKQGELPIKDIQRIALVGNLICLGASATLLLCGWWLTRILLGPAYAESGGWIVGLVGVSQAIRNVLAAYTTAAIALGLQHRLFLGPLVEGILAVAVSLTLAPSYGVKGVLCAMMLAPVGNIAFTIFTNPVGRLYADFDISKFIFRAAVLPSVPFFFAILIWTFSRNAHDNSLLMLSLGLLFGCSYLFCAVQNLFDDAL